ncbi:poly [ADP-ribose] polymerase 2-like isoform X2 [Macrobrachium rosenbergii]|uniref:poly [ADP-ribose] polymerase 2-like isoform X2 n=1 Tax=Macrobrachium rosenbergii TaxID=79674 RepID=UPI0034D69524
MARRKGAAAAASSASQVEAENSANEPETGRRSRKRAVNDAANSKKATGASSANDVTVKVEDVKVEVDSDDEPLAKKGKDTQKDETVPKGNIKRGRKNVKNVKAEVDSDDEPLVKKGKASRGKKEDDTAVGEEPKKRGRPTKKGTAETNSIASGSGIGDADIDTNDAVAKKGSKAKGAPSKAEPSVSSESTKGRGKRKGKSIKEEPVEEEASLPTKPAGGREKSGKSKPKSKSGKENVDSSNVPRDTKIKSGVERTVVLKGRAPVDALCPIATTSHVLEEDSDIWDCMLNQTNIQFNNNKYYLIQLLKDDGKDAYSVWMRWGRVGANGQNSLQACGGDLEKAKKIFMKKFNDKTRNDWNMRDCFEKQPGKYDLLEMDYSREDKTDSAIKANDKIKEERKKIECTLEIRVRALIELLCDIRVMEEAVVEMKYDAKKAPLGKLTTEQIKAGYLALKNIDDIIMKGKYTSMELVHACNAFYTRIPHYFGMKVPPLIKTKAEIQEKVALLEALGDIQAALSVLDQPIDVSVHPVDQQYNSLQCSISLLSKDADDYKVLEKYLQSTHAKTHSNFKMELLEAFVIRKEMEYERFKDVGNCMLLYHGSRLSNWAGILSQGLRIAPPEAPSTGYMFGKGIYFADMSSKSANYCWATPRNDTGFLALSEVSLGKTNDLLDADYNAHKLPKGFHSVKGCGKTAPIPENLTKLSDGTVVPMGPGVQTGVNNPKGYTLLYNEYIVYNPSQVRTRFLLKIKFNFR